MKKIFLVLLAFLASLSYSQELQIKNSPYDNANEYTLKRNSFNRERWFYEQRMYPNNYIPEKAYENAYNQKVQLNGKYGYYFDKTTAWINLGPTPGYYFSYGNISSRITSVKYDPVNPNIIYIGAAFGGIWKSTNGGINWSPKSDNEISLSTGAIAIDPSNTNTIYYGTGEATYSGASYYGRGLLKSTNGGDNWMNYKTGLPNFTYFSRIVIRPNHNSELLAALGSNGIYRSSNAGVSWNLIRGGRCDDVLFSLTGDTAYIIGSGQGIRISIDGGLTFPTAIGTEVVIGERNHFAMCKSSPNIFYASVYSSAGTVSVYKSTNYGFNFSQVAKNFDFSGGQAWYDFYMHVNPFDPNCAYVGTIVIFRTTDGGISFQNISGDGVHVDQHNMDFHPTDPNKLFCVNDGGVWTSNDRGSSWTNLNSSLTLTQFYRMTSDPSNPNHLLGGTQDNGTQQTTGAMNWSAAFGGDGGEVCFSNQNQNYILGETQNNGLYRSVNNGGFWVPATSGLSGNGAWVSPILSHPDSNGVFYTARQQVFKTTDYAASWTPISTGTGSGIIEEMAISKSKSNLIYASAGSTLFISTNAGYSFKQLSTGMPNRTITSIYIHPDSSSVAIVSFSGFGGGKVYKTTNEGVSWVNISGDLPDTPINDALIYYPGFSTSIYLVATDVGVFMTNNYGIKWVELANGLPNTVAMHLDFNAASGKIRIGTHGRGTWELTGSIIGIANNSNEIPVGFSLSQNYPNPFNPNTKIGFKIKNSGQVTLKVYDVIGKEITTLINKKLYAGSFESIFYGENYSSGLYFYSLFVDGVKIDTKKMILIK